MLNVDAKNDKNVENVYGMQSANMTLHKYILVIFSYFTKGLTLRKAKKITEKRCFLCENKNLHVKAPVNSIFSQNFVYGIQVGILPRN